MARQRDTLKEILDVLIEIRDLMEGKEDVEAVMGFSTDEEEDDDEYNEEIECGGVAKDGRLAPGLRAGPWVLGDAAGHTAQCKGPDRVGHGGADGPKRGFEVHKERKWR